MARRRFARQLNRDLAWMGIGVAIGLLVAPWRGRDLRHRIGIQALHWSKRSSRFAVGHGKDLANRAAGLVARGRRLFVPAPAVDASILLERVHSRLGHVPDLPLAHVNLNAVGRVIVLHGWVHSEAEAERLAQAIREVEGVVDVSLEHLQIQPAA